MSTKIISISGNIGSGKDVAARIIRRLDMVKLIEKGDVSAQMLPTLNSLLEGEPYISSNWKVKKFASSLKFIAGMLTGFPQEKFEDREFKQSSLGDEWGGMTVREFLQRLGTDSVRNNLHPNTWVNALFNSIKPDENAIITDTRFPNELEAVKKHGGITIRLVRGERNPDVILHESETALDNAVFDYEVENYSTIEELEFKLKNILIEQQIL